MTPRYTQALLLAATAHEGQFRKGTQVPYISHPVAVAALVAQHGGDEDQQIAGLLHDVLEDAGPQYGLAIDRAFGPRVLGMVKACTDGVPDNSGRKQPWKDRKVRYIEHLRHAADDVLLVSACDKLHNSRSILADLETGGLLVFKRFHASQLETLWYYSELSTVFMQRESAVGMELMATVTALQLKVDDLTGRGL